MIQYLFKPVILCASLTLGSLFVSTTALAQNEFEIASFTGNEDITFPRADSLDISEFGAIELWVKPVWGDDKEQDAALISYMGSEGSRYAVILTQDKSKIGLLSRDQWDWVSADFTTNRIRHVFINLFGEFSDVYIDGELAGTILSGTSDVFANRLHVGSFDGDNFIFTGDMTGIRIWDSPMDEELISKYASKDIFGDIKHPEIDSLLGGSIWVKEGDAEGLSFKLTDETDSVVFVTVSDDPSLNEGQDADLPIDSK